MTGENKHALLTRWWRSDITFNER